MTLGELIKKLESYPPDKICPLGLARFFSWRGVYAELAFSVEPNVPVADMLKLARGAVGQVLTGYKGGEYTMTSGTPIHLEQSHRNYTDGEYAASICKLLLDIVLLPGVSYDSTELAEKAMEAMLRGSMTDQVLARILEDVPEPTSPRIPPEEERARAAFLSLWLKVKGDLSGSESHFFLPWDQAYPEYFDKWFTEKGWKAIYDRERQTLSLYSRRFALDTCSEL